MSAPEAAWRLFGFRIHEQSQSHTIVRLQVHLPGEQSVYFTEDNIHTAIDRAETSHTTLTAWFHLNMQDASAKSILYPDIPQTFVFDDRTRLWKPRKRGAHKTIGRMYSVNLSSDVERFCLRLLLLHVPGTTSYEDLKTVNGLLSPSFKDAAQKRGLFDDDNTWDFTLHEAATEKMPQQLRELFAHLCIMAVPSNIPDLFLKYKDQLCEDNADMKDIQTIAIFVFILPSGT